MKYKIFTVTFLVLCFVPSLGMLVLPPTEPAANERLSQKPRLYTEDGAVNMDVLNEAGDYVGDHFALRQQLVTLNAHLNTGLLGTSPAKDVIYGKNGWLYYAKTLDDYRNHATLTELDIQDVADTLLEIQAFCEGRGARFLFTIAPNKNSLYPENMPSRYIKKGAKNNYAILEPLLRENGINYADLFSMFSLRDEILYLKADSHWTNYGAAAAHDFLMETLNLAHTKFEDAPYATEAMHLGDLYSMLYPKGTKLEEQQQYDFSFSHKSEPRSTEDILIETQNPNAQNGRLMLFRDSFGNALYPFFAEDFREAVISRQMPYPLYEVRSGDTVIIEIVERNIPNLLKYPPDFGNNGK